MAQSEDTELTDLVVEALEKNGSLAKIRALLRANIFLAFEDDCENLKQNDILDKMLALPEGKLCLSIVHEFLNFCNLKNTLFVYKSETRQGREYTYDGGSIIADKLNLRNEKDKEPLLLTLIKNVIKLNQRSSYNQNDKQNDMKKQIRGKSHYLDKNSTYIVNEDSSTTSSSHSHSDNSSDEKNKLDLRLTLDNSDTDTSSGSTRGRTSSEYIVNNHTSLNVASRDENVLHTQSNKQMEQQNSTNKNNVINNYVQDLKLLNNSSDSTSYIELKPFNPIDSVLLNTTGLPLAEEKLDVKTVSPQNSVSSPRLESLSQAEGNTNSEKNISVGSQGKSKSSPKISQMESVKYDAEATEYSYDFASPVMSARNDTSEKSKQNNRSMQDDTLNKSNNSSMESHKQNSPSSQSSVSLSDVADLISERSNQKISNHSSYHKLSASNSLKRSVDGNNQIKNISDDSGDFSDSPIPSLSNLSLDIHSD